VSVWDDIVGQQRVVAELQAAVAGLADVPLADESLPDESSERDVHTNGSVERDVQTKRAAAGSGVGMTHAWLLTGPPGSGRSIAARAFAAALQCTAAERGCGRCKDCHTVLAGSHADVETVSTELLSIGVRDTRELVRRAALAPSGGRWQIIILEDADRLTDQAANALLKAIEEPAPRTVWMLCAPSQEDVLPTLRSRCRHVRLVTPTVKAVADVLVRRDGIDPAMAAFAARVSQGHIGRAKRLATDEGARLRRQEVLSLPQQVADVGPALTAAANLVDAVKEEAQAITAVVDAAETEQVRAALGADSGRSKLPPGSAGVLKDLEQRQKRRATRQQRDALDRALVDLAGFYRDVLAVQLDAPVELTNAELRPTLHKLARAATPEATLRRIEAILACREAVEANVAPLLAVEAMTLALRAG
jgi:DNA polymerase-3 subunit delta'